MNTLKHGTRALLASAAAGALVLGSAAGVMAHPSTPKAPKAPKAGYMQLRMVDVHNSPFNVAKPRTIKVKANVWDTVKGAAPTLVTVTLAQYDKKGGTQVADADAVVADITVPLTTKASMDRKSKNYAGAVKSDDVLAQLTEAEREALKTKSALMCISAVTLEGTSVKTPAKRQVTKKVGKDCFRLVNVAPVK